MSRRRHTRGAAHQPTSSRYGFLRQGERHRAALAYGATERRRWGGVPRYRPTERAVDGPTERRLSSGGHRAAAPATTERSPPPSTRAVGDSEMRVSITWKAPPKFRLGSVGGARSDAPLRAGETRAAQRVGGTQRHERRPKPTHRGGGWLAPSDRGWITSCHLRVRSVHAGQGMDRRGGPPATSGVLRRPAGAPARTCCPLQVMPDSK